MATKSNTNKRNQRKPWSNKKNTKMEPESKVAKEKYNDPSWYVKDGQLAKDVASLSFNNALGAPSSLEYELSYVSESRTPFTLVQPGIMTIFTSPAMGYSGDGSSPINIAAKNIYSYVRHQNSGHSNYDAPDLMIYLGAMDSIYAFIATLMRAYGTARVFSQTNRYVGDALLKAQGFDPLDLRANLADFRAYINMYITKASAFCTPDIMSLYRRHFWMFSGIYKDEDITKSQMYLYRPATLWKFEELDGAGKLTAVHVGTTMNTNGINDATWSLSEWRTLGNNLLAALNNSEDINIMSGDILKAYGQGNLWSLGLINEDYAVLPVYSDEVLDQIHNTTFVGNKPTTGVNQTTTTTPQITLSGLDVRQNVDPNQDGRIVFTPEFIGVSSMSYSRIIDLHTNDPTPEEVLVATRNSVMGAKIDTGDTIVNEILTCGSDLALFGIVYTMSGGSYSAWYVGTTEPNSHNNIQSAYYRFNRAPLLYGIASSSKTGSGAVNAIFGEIDNYTIISYDDLRRMHESAILAMLGVPFYGLHSTQGK